MDKQILIDTEFCIEPRMEYGVSPMTGEINSREVEGYSASLIIRVGQEHANIIQFPYFADDGKEAVERSISMLETMKNDIDIGIETLKRTLK